MTRSVPDAPESTVAPQGPADAVTQTPPQPAAPAQMAPPAHARATKPRAGVLRWIAIAGGILALIGIAWWLIESWNTVSTDDAYVNGHVTFVAPRVAGQVMRVLADDNNRVRRGDLLVQLDRTPYQVQVNIAQAAVTAAQSDLVEAQAQSRALVGQTRSLRYALEHAIEDVDNQVSLLRSRVASLNSAKASSDKAGADFDRAVPLVKTGGISQEDYDKRKEALAIAQASYEEALQGVYQIRVGLGLPPRPEGSDDLTQVPADLDQTFSSVRQAQSSLLQSAAQLGVVQSFTKSPRDLVNDFYKRDPSGDINRIYEQILAVAPAVMQAKAKLLTAQRNLDEANLNLSYCDIVSEIDGVVTRRNVNPGNNVIAGQSLMAVRSLTDIWIDANFKETQLAKLRIGQPVDLDVDMYGSRQHFEGRISGFTMGTGSTLALLPAENATGNFVKVVQRLPVRIDLLDYDPDRLPLFIGLSVTPTVHLNEEPAGPSAGKILQPYLAQAQHAPEQATPALPLPQQPTTDPSQLMLAPAPVQP